MNKKLASICVCAVMGAISFILMLIEFNIPLVPSFLKFDISDLPALITSFAFGPLYGIIVCLIKNLLHLPLTSSFCIGELSNFVLSSTFVFTAGLIYAKNKCRKNALIGSCIGSFGMGLICIPLNYYIIYPAYSVLIIKMQAIMGMYKAIMPKISNLWQALIIFNLPFTFFKGIIVSVICFVIYKKLSPILKKFY